MGKKITVPSDIRNVKSKIGPFEIRQAITSIILNKTK